MVRELVFARRRGVDVRVVLPFEANHDVMNKSNVVTANLLFDNGAQVYLYPGMSHAKAAVYDGWCCVGSANFDWLSFQRNLELNIGTSHPEAVQALEEQFFEPDFAKSIRMKEPIPANWKTYVARILSGRL